MIDCASILPTMRPDDIAGELEGSVYFNGEVSPNNPGFLSLDGQPFFRDMLAAVVSPKVKQIVLCTGAQLGKSTFLNLAALAAMEYRQGSCLWLLPTDTMAKRAVKKRLLPLIQCNPKYAALLPYGQVSYADSIPLRGFPVYYSGVQKASKLAERPANMVIMDEAAKYGRGHQDEADPISLARERTKSFAGSLVIMASTPNTEENKFWQSYLEGTQSKWVMPCPHCSKEMEFAWNNDGVKWDENAPATARLICPHCQGKIDDRARRAMIRLGHWVDGNPAARDLGLLSFHLNSLYSPYVSIGELARKFVAAAHSLTAKDDLQNFYNSDLGLPYTQHLTKIYDADIQSLVNPLHHRGQLPLDTQAIIMGVDIGQNASHWAVTAITLDGGLSVIDWGTLISPTTTSDNEGIAALFDRLCYRDTAGNEMRCDLCLIDSGYSTQCVYDECLRASIPGTLIPVKGADGARGGAWARSKIRTMPQAPFDLILFQDFQLKKALYLDAIGAKRLTLPAETDNALIQGLSGQEMRRRPGGSLYWKNVIADHYGDCVKYAILAGWMMTAG